MVRCVLSCLPNINTTYEQYFPKCDTIDFRHSFGTQFLGHEATDTLTLTIPLMMESNLS